MPQPCFKDSTFCRKNVGSSWLLPTQKDRAQWSIQIESIASCNSYSSLWAIMGRVGAVWKNKVLTKILEEKEHP
jgi:hypothetical protein